MMKHKGRFAVVGGAILALVVTGCSSNTGESGKNKDHEAANFTISTDAKESEGPADRAKDATDGGTITYLQDRNFSHWDPTRNYAGSSMLALNDHIYRTLTGYREFSDGTVKVVGDLATDAGKDVNDDCKVWEWTLKDGLKYEDGSEIKAEDVAYNIYRSFSSELLDGPQFLHQWLDPEGKDPGPWTKGKRDKDKILPPGVEVDGKKLTMTFDAPRCETPFATAMTVTAPVPPKEDTGVKYDERPFSSGPYKIKEHKLNESAEFERNEHWDADTDPLRPAYPDTVKYEFGADNTELTTRVEADAKGDETLVNLRTIDPANLASIMEKEKDYGDRLIQSPSAYTSYMAINTENVKDLDVRKALNLAFPRDRWVQANGGKDAVLPSTTLTGPTVAGYEDYAVYGKNNTEANIKKAKELLKGKKVSFKYAHSDTEAGGKIAQAIVDGYAKAGIEIKPVPITPDNYYDQIGVENDWDMYVNIWAQDWPQGSTIIGPLWHSSGIGGEAGGTNYGRINEKAIDEAIDKLNSETGTVEELGKKWNDLGKTIMEDYAPVIPLDYNVGTYMCGSGLGGFKMSQAITQPQPASLYVKKEFQ